MRWYVSQKKKKMRWDDLKIKWNNLLSMTIQLFIIIKGLDNPLKQVLYKENLDVPVSKFLYGSELWCFFLDMRSEEWHEKRSSTTLKKIHGREGTMEWNVKLHFKIIKIETWNSNLPYRLFCSLSWLTCWPIHCWPIHWITPLGCTTWTIVYSILSHALVNGKNLR